MSRLNETNEAVQAFLIVGFPGFQERDVKNVIFGSLLTVYFFIILGNLLIIVIFLHDEDLHIPMYILISCLGLVDIIIATNTVPKMLAIFGSDSNLITISACFTQMFFTHTTTTVEALLLALMAYDRYLAICKPLHYHTLTSNALVLKQIACCWVCGFIVAIIPIILAYRLPFCGPNKVVHCYCDHSSVLKLACTDTSLNTYVGLSLVLSVLIAPLIYILFSYTRILISVLKISTHKGRVKAFSTCATHLLVISVFFLVGAGVYICNRIPGTSADVRILMALIQNVTPPLMNPIIYCLRSKEIQQSFWKTLRRNKTLPKNP
ncbi:olfactory receptor 6N1-like [Erpetoichthys calabaricus]|uniref:olfactory receptor 6N1-like n=1 Tax=Erpetoichthys calabaricus TaxID=27687 RepID=UPI00223400A5|nr:olfactory receptor 6N1-like [Erpetoichthys calabaricus]